MYPYPPGPYGPRPDANMMAAYCQQQQQHFFQQQQQRQGGQWNNGNGMHLVLDHNSNMQGMVYPNFMAQHFTPQMGYPMWQQQQPYGQFNAPMCWPNNNNNLQPQRPGWAESRPGRTPCKDDWWSHVKDEMQFIDSPIGIDLEKEDEHANVLEELKRTGTTSGVVNDGDDMAATFDEHTGQAGDAAVAAGAKVGAPFPSTPPIGGTTEQATPEGLHHGFDVQAGGGGDDGANARQLSDGDQEQQQQQKQHYRRASASKGAGQEEGGEEAKKAGHGGRPHNKHRRGSQSDGNEEGKLKKRGHTSKSHRRHSRKNGNEAPPEGEPRHGGSMEESTTLGISLFVANSTAAPPAGPPPTTREPGAAPRIPPPRHRAVDKGSCFPAHNQNNVNGHAAVADAVLPLPATAAAIRRTTTNNPCASIPAEQDGSPSKRLPPLHPNEVTNQNTPSMESQAGGVVLEASVMQAGASRPSTTVDENNGAATPAAAAANACRRSSTVVGGPGYSLNGNSRTYLSTPVLAVEDAEAAEALTGQHKANRSCVEEPRGRDQRRYSYFSSRRPTAVVEEENDNEEGERDSNGNGIEESSSSSSSSSSTDSDEEGSDDNDDEEEEEEKEEEEEEEEEEEVEFSVMRRTPDHSNHPGRSILEYSAFREVPGGGNVVRGESDSHCDFSTAVGGVGDGAMPPPRSSIHHGATGEPRRSVVSYGIGSLNNSGASDVPPHKGRLVNPSVSITMLSNTPGMDDQTNMMAEMSVVERECERSITGAGTLPLASGRSPAQPQSQGKAHSLPMPREEDSPRAAGKPQTHSTLPDTIEPTSAAVAARERKQSDVDVSESAMERLQRVGRGRHIPPKIAAKPTAATTTAATAPQTTLPNVEKSGSQSAGSSPSHSAAAAAAAAAVTKRERQETKLPPARTSEKPALPSATGATRASLALDNGKSKDTTGQESPAAGTGKLSVAAANATVAPKKPPFPATSNAAEVSRGSSDPSVRPSLPTSGTGKRPSVFQRMPMRAETAAHHERPCAPSPSEVDTVAPTTEVARNVIAATSSSGVSGTSGAGGEIGKASSRNGLASTSGGTAKTAPAFSPPAASSGTPPVRNATQPSLPHQRPGLSPRKKLQPTGNVVPAASVPSSFGSPKRASRGPATPPSARPNTTAPGTDNVATVAGLTKSAERSVSKETRSSVASSKGLSQGCTTSSPLQLSSNARSPASSSTSTAVANASLRKDAEANRVSPTTAAMPRPTPPNAARNVHSWQPQPLPTTHASQTTSPTTVPLGGSTVGCKAGTQPAAHTSTGTAVSAGKATTMLHSKHSPNSSVSPTTMTEASPLNKWHDSTVHGGGGAATAAHRPTPTASTETNVGTVSGSSSHRSDGGSGASVVRISSTEKVSTRQPGNASAAPLCELGTVPSHATTSPQPDRKAATTPAVTATTAKSGSGLDAPMQAVQMAPKTSNAAVNDDNDIRDAWMAEMYDFYAYKGGSLSDDDAEPHYERVVPTPMQSESTENRGTTPSTSTAQGGARRLSTTAGSLADMGYIIF